MNNIREIRENAKISKRALSKALHISEKSLQRYENGMTPDGNCMRLLANYFNVGLDYLLNYGPREEQINLVKQKWCCYPVAYDKYIHCINQYSIDYNERYYEIELNKDYRCILNQWGGFTEDHHEIRIPRKLDPSTIEKFGMLDRPRHMVLNSKEDVDVFLLYKGWAFVSEKVCKEYLPWYLEPTVIEPIIS